MNPQSLTLSLQQHESEPGDVARSLERIAQSAKQAAAKGSQLLLMPEASLTGYNNSLEVMQSIAEPSDGPASDTIAQIAKKHQIAIAYGFAERFEQHIFNSVQLISKTGERISIYRKTHLWGDQDRTLFSQGEKAATVFELHGWKMGMLICYDVEFPEAVRALALQGAELILIPTALMSPWTTVADKVVPIRAYENQLFIAYANFCGAEYEQHYVGHSCIVGPDAENLAKAGPNAALLHATISKAAITQMREALPYHRDRRPELYTSLATTKAKVDHG